MENCIHDHGGNLFRVEYVIEPDGVPRIESMHALDATYQPAGPDLCAVFNDLLIMVGPGQVTRYLSIVTESIHASRRTAAGGH